MAMLRKEDILTAKDAAHIDLEVPEWGGTVRVSTMTGFARDRFDASIISKNGTSGPNTENIRAKLVAACLVDEAGNLLFNEADIAKLGKKSCKVLDKIFEAAQKLNGIGDAEVEQKAKN